MKDLFYKIVNLFRKPLRVLTPELSLAKEYLYRGWDRNIICYDVDAKSGHFTKRLIHIMMDVYYNNSSGEYSKLTKIPVLDDKMHTIYVGPNGFKQLKLNEYKSIKVVELSYMLELERIFKKELYGSLGSLGKDKHLVIGVGYNDVLLGSY